MSQDIIEDRQALVQQTCQWIEGLYAHFNLEIKVAGEASEEEMSLNITGKDAGLMIEGLGMGQGQMISTLQTVTSAFLQRHGWRAPLRIDALSYRKKREESLAAVAKVLGDKVAATGKAITVLGMNSFDRRAVHSGLQNDARVTTESEGGGVMRRLKVR